jgi:hypothetical protein
VETQAFLNILRAKSRCYNGPAMKELATENIVIGVLASIGVLVLIVVFIYVVRQVITRKD